MSWKASPQPAQQSCLSLSAQYVEPFVRAAFTVLHEVAGCRCERGPLSMRSGTTFTTQEVTVVVGVNGEIHGVALYGMSVVTALKIAGAMMGQELVQLDEMALSAVSELANMISGRAATLLDRSGISCDITPPSIVRGVGTEITVPAATLLIPVTTDLGSLSIDVSLRPSSSP